MQWKTNRKLYVAYRIALIPLPGVTLKVTFAVWNLSNSHSLRNIALLISVCLHMNRKAQVSCNFSCLVETEGLLKVTGSDVYGRCVNI